MNYDMQAKAAAQGMVYGGIEKLGERQTEIPRYSAELEKALACCAEGLERLESRLCTVTSSEPPSPTTATAAGVSVPQCDWGRRLQEMGGQAMSISARIQSLVRRLEV